MLTAPVKIEPGETGLRVTCIQMALGEPDASGRRRPVPQPGSESVLEFDDVIAAIGQGVNVQGLAEAGLQLSRWNTLVVNNKTMQTNLPNVFAGGDCVLGPDIAVRAVGMGRQAAAAIDQFVRGETVVGERERFNSSMGTLNDIPAAFFERQASHDRHSMPVIADARRNSTFDEVETGLPEATAREEAARCLRCGCEAAEDCALRDYATEYGATQSLFCGAKRRDYELDDTHPLVRFETGKCIQCGTCVRLLNEKYSDYSLGFANRGFSACIKPPFGQSLGKVLKDPARSEAIVAACPTGALVRN